MRCLCCIVTLQFIARGSRAAPILRREDVCNVLVADAVRCEGQALALRLRRGAARAAVVRGPVPRNRSLILAILIILAILLQTL